MFGNRVLTAAMFPFVSRASRGSPLAWGHSDEVPCHPLCQLPWGAAYRGPSPSPLPDSGFTPSCQCGSCQALQVFQVAGPEPQSSALSSSAPGSYGILQVSTGCTGQASGAESALPWPRLSGQAGPGPSTSPPRWALVGRWLCIHWTHMAPWAHGKVIFQHCVFWTSLPSILLIGLSQLGLPDSCKSEYRILS